MRKVILTVLLLLCFISTNTISNADDINNYEDYANKLAKINVFKGTQNGFELNRQPNRLEGLVMMIRLLGKEAEADGLKNQPCPFTDVPDWGKGYVNYAYNNQLTKGIASNIYGTKELLDGNSYLTFLLRALGYRDDTSALDFNWKSAKEFALNIGLLDANMYTVISNNPFIRGYIAKLSYDVLRQPMKNDPISLIQKLVTEGAISQTSATEVGFEVNLESDDDVIPEKINALFNSTVYIEVEGFDGDVVEGNGFYISSSGRLIMSYDLLAGAKSVRFVESKGKSYTHRGIKIIGYDEEADIAILDVNRDSTKSMKLGDSDKLEEDQKVYLVNSIKGIKIGAIEKADEDTIETNFIFKRRNNGGALVNEAGEVIGIISQDSGNDNGSIAVPINRIKEISRKLSLSLGDFNDEIGFMPDEIYQGKVFENYNNLSFDDEKVIYDFYIIEPKSDSEELSVNFYITETSFTNFLAIVGKPNGVTYLENYFEALALEISDYYGQPVDFYLKYYGAYENYPEEFEENNFENSTIVFNEETESWLVIYPLLNAYSNNDSKERYSLWWF